MSARHDPAAYGRAWAHDYDALYEERDDASQVAAFVAALEPSGRVLELGVGTGRLAIPLVDAGLQVTGVDASPEMLDRLRARPGADKVHLIEGDFVSTDADGPFDVALIAFSTLFLIPSQQGQLDCLANVRRQLRPGGHLVVEAFVPDHSRWTRGQNLSIGHVDADGASLKLSVHDAVEQVITTQEIVFDGRAPALRPNLLRYAWPAELDAMALASGLRRVGRWADWDRRPFTAASPAHISVFQTVDLR
jgi:SAM-dependent methyltransferase